MKPLRRASTKDRIKTRIKTQKKTRFIPRTALLLGPALLACSQVSAQSIFEGLPYSEQEIRTHIAQAHLNVVSTDAPEAVPENIYYRLAFLGLLADPVLMASLPEADAQIIRSLPAHEDERFVREDRRELSEVCDALNDSLPHSVPQGQTDTQGIISFGRSFDHSRARREQDLDAHYAQVLEQLTPATRQRVHEDVQWLDSPVTYAVFSLEHLALAAPEIAEAILRNGCDNFDQQGESALPQSVLLADQLDPQVKQGVSE